MRIPTEPDIRACSPLHPLDLNASQRNKRNVALKYNNN